MSLKISLLGALPIGGIPAKPPATPVEPAFPPLPYARSANYIVGETDHPNTSTYAMGESVWLYFWGAGLPASGTDNLVLGITDSLGAVIASANVPILADASGNWQVAIQAPSTRYGYYRVTATTQTGGKALPAFGTRFAGYMTYAVVFDPANRVGYGEHLTRFGMQGSVQANCQDILGYLGVRWQLDSFYRWGDLEQSGPNTYNIADSTPIPDITVRGAPWKTYGMASVVPNMPPWAVVSGPLGDLNATGLANFGAFCTKVANRYMVNNPNRTNALFEISWEPYPGRWTGTNAGFVKIHELAHNAIKAAYAAAGKTCTIMSPSLFAGSSEMDGWIAAGLTNYIDAYSVHAYSELNGAMEALPGRLRSDANKFNNAKGSVMPLYNNEAGFPTNRVSANPPYDESGLTAARGNMKNALIVLGEGFKYTMFFYLADFTDEQIGWGYNYNLNPTLGGGYGTDKISPKIHVPAASALTLLLDGSTSQGEIVFPGTTTAFAYKFLRQDGRTVIAVANHGADTTQTVTVPNGKLDVYDWMGNMTTVDITTGSCSLTAKQEPTYLVYPGTNPLLV